MSAWWALGLSLCVLLATPTGAAVANMRLINPDIWSTNRFVLASNYPQLQFVQNTLPRSGVQPEQTVAQPLTLIQPENVNQLFPVYEQDDVQLLAANGLLPQNGFVFPSQPLGQRTFIVANTPNQALSSIPSVAETVEEKEISANSNSSPTTSSKGTAIIGGPTDGVIGADGQILGSTQDTAVVDSAGQLGPTLFKAPVAYSNEAILSYQPQPIFSTQQGLQYPYSNYQIPDQATTIQIAVDQYGQPILGQTMQGTQLVDASYPASV
ncbi:hypothetical protein P879_06146 [Paragonimus westermani]|uniref:Uncharacterized protein n=1 Tax=Paragonimus westermani TaxID=34504 RepID=A0A8T0D352_9TREM|nr:hypothetical protein P879_06146 [Paragonimus westermani]